MHLRSHRSDLRSILPPTAIATIAWLAGFPGVAQAHGGMAGPQEIGPPLLTSVALGFVCYWLVILWPSSKRKDDASTANDRRGNKGRRDRRRAVAKAGESQHLTPVTKVAGKGRS